MQQMMELYEMVSMNDTALRGTEKLQILKARLALHMFERAMRSFSTELSHTSQSMNLTATAHPNE